MAEYSLRLESEKDYRIIKKLLKAFEGASITPIRKRNSGMNDPVGSRLEGKAHSAKVEKRLQAFDKLAARLSMDRIDTEDPRTKYLLSK
ncbi:MAG: hypothetical protein K2L11_11650 [Muribaculaceae bacterium]|nr:hypothetical protein [Muribaculaceae bacterium]